jgi:hypothetical protein
MGLVLPGPFFGGRADMKTVNRPLILLMGFSFLLLQLALVNRFFWHTDQDQQTIVETTQSIPDTFSLAIHRSDSEPAGVKRLLQGSFSHGVEDEINTGSEIPSQNIGGAVAQLSENDVLDISSISAFNIFLQEVFNGDGDTITGVFVEGLFSLRVVQQPFQDAAFVSNEKGTATQFQSPALFGVVGLLAHNYLSGRHFLYLSPGHEIRLVYGDGTYRRYQVVEFVDFERLTRSDVRSDFRDLKTQSILTNRQVFDRFYRGENKLTLQTCLEGDGYSNWGIRMVSAVPMDIES